MLHGSHPAKIDSMGRLKLPRQFLRALLLDSNEVEVFVSSLSGENVFIYPLSVWEHHIRPIVLAADNEESLAEDYLRRVNRYGRVANVDSKGRLVVPAELRQSAGIQGEVSVLGMRNYIEIWNTEKIDRELDEKGPWDSDKKKELVDIRAKYSLNSDEGAASS